MAIFDSEKRPRGLRVPSLAAFKSFQKKSSEPVPTEPVPSGESTSPKATAFPTPPPPKPAPPPGKDLPVSPKEEIPAPQTLTNNPYFPPIPSQNAVPDRRPIERVPNPMQSPPPRMTGLRNKKSQPDFHAPQQQTTNYFAPQAPADEANSPRWKTSSQPRTAPNRH
ncbi:uncharacterized protein N7518_000563 [Penicillium psychrosexuale]|uniref:uncharacterized protein n=1 Tax=Penicillium psychrosexuale TaxID=1002107 RepID=UPI0025452AC1|nr:uncharacterized protein N7518_000563 [Penicillium psychrosexuale]KAJ5804260.1 hypothetical protein N7518_000563 [Penicillium psychrosexuale]